MSRRHPESSDLKHRAALQKEIERLRNASPVGWRTLTGYIPEMELLRESLVELLELADPRKGRVLDTSRGNSDPLSADGRSTAEGRATLPDRERLSYFRRRIKALAREMTDSREFPDRRALPRKRCLNPSCRFRGRRQPALYAFCGYCGATMEEAA